MGGVTLAPSSVGSSNFSGLENFEAAKSRRSPQNLRRPLPPRRHNHTISAARRGEGPAGRQGAPSPPPLGSEGWPRHSARAGRNCFLLKTGELASAMDLILFVLSVSKEVAGEER